MSRSSMVRAVVAAVGMAGALAAGATETITIDAGALHVAGCFGLNACTVEGANLTTSGNSLAKKVQGDTKGFGVSGGASGPEIDIGESLRVSFGQPRTVIGIQVLFLYNGPEFNDKAEVASVTAGGATYTLSVSNDADDADAVWTGAGSVSKCGATTAAGTGCFLITDPFPGAVSEVEFQAAQGGWPFSGSGSNNSDYALGFIDVAAQTIVELQECSGEAGCEVATVGDTVAFSLNSMQATNPGGSTEALVIPVQFPDCRYVPQACLDLLPPAGDAATSDDARRSLLIDLGVIKPLDPYGANKLNPAAQILNVTPLLPVEVTSLFDASGTPPDGLPPLYIGARWRGQAINTHRIDAFFFKTDSGVVFNDVFGGLVDVGVLTDNELGCEADNMPLSDLLAWDMITTVSELAKGVGGRYIDMPVNVGCVNPSKVTGSRLSLFSINLEPVSTTYGPTVKSSKAKVTVNNDAVFARMVQSLWRDLGEVRAQYACKQADPAPAGGVAPLSSSACKKLASLWSVADFKIDLCVAATFGPANWYQGWICGLAAEYVASFKAAIPAAASGPDPYNRRGELGARTEVFQHIWSERFLKSIKPGGFCREKGSCPP